jgi:hypothetical protein
MEHYTILDHSSASPAMGGEMRESGASGSEAQSVLAGIAVGNGAGPRTSGSEARLAGEDAGRSLAELAERDLDAALQLLADRAQYITGASGAAIALRRGEHNDMLCRASAGGNAPELGALLSMEYGLSGECVRTRQILRCDDAERDARVNREVCRELGIASVVVMPIVSGEQVLGVFELLSGKARAFEERDLSALLRLSVMVETAVKHAVATQIASARPETAVVEVQPEVEVEAAEVVAVAAVEVVVVEDAKEDAKVEAAEVVVSSAPAPAPATISQEVSSIKQEEGVAAPKKALFWTSAGRSQGGGDPNENAGTIAVPPVLRNLRKCQACGFPVSQGRAFCVECEERQWRGQRMAHLAVRSQKDQGSPAPQRDSKEPAVRGYAGGTFIRDSSAEEVSIGATEARTAELGTAELRSVETGAAALTISAAGPETSAAQNSVSSSIKIKSAHAEEPAAPQTTGATSSSSLPDVASEVPAEVVAPDNSAPFLSSALQSESWFASNKYILGALLVVAVVIAAIAWLH